MSECIHIYSHFFSFFLYKKCIYIYVYIYIYIYIYLYTYNVFPLSILDLTTLNYQYYGSGQLLCEVERHLTQSPLIQPLLGGEGEGDVGENDLLTGSRVHSHSQGCQQSHAPLVDCSSLSLFNLILHLLKGKKQGVGGWVFSETLTLPQSHLLTLCGFL